MDSGIAQEESNVVRVKIQQKKNKKVTIIENVPQGQQKHVLDSLKREMACGGSRSEDGTYIQLQGDKTHMGIVAALKKYIGDCKVELNGKIS